MFPGSDFPAMRDLLDDPRPVLAFCRSGTRCANLWVASVEVAEREEAMKIASQQHFDLGMASRYIAEASSRAE